MPVAVANPLALDTQDTLRASLVPLTLRISRLGAVAQVLSHLGPVQQQTTDGLLLPFKRAKEQLAEAQQLSRRGGEQAAAALAEIERETVLLQQLIAAADSEVTASALRAHLAAHHELPAFVLGRLLEHYASSGTDPQSERKKFLAVAATLAERHELPGEDPDQLLKVLGRRGIQLDDQAARPGPEQLDQSQQLQLLFAYIDEVEDAELEAYREALDGFQAELGDALYSNQGLAHMLCLYRLLRRIEHACDEAQLAALMDFGLGTETETSAESMAFSPVDAADDPETLEELARLESELVQSVAAGNDDEAGFMLDEPERKAALGQGNDDVWNRSLVRCVACRTAVDRLARTHARRGQPEGGVPDPMPLEVAGTLLRHALRLEEQLQDAIQHSIFGGQSERAKQGTRSLHRLSRARLGLAILAELPAQGDADAPAPTAAPTSKGRARDQLEERQLRQMLQKAQLVRDALRRRDTPDQTRRLPRGAAAWRLRQQRRKRLLWGGLAASGLIAFLYHAPTLSKLFASPAFSMETVSKAVPMKSAAPLERHFVGVAEPGWEDLPEGALTQSVNQLWADLQKAGYRSMVLMTSTGQRPLAQASPDAGVKLIPIAIRAR